MSEFVKCKCGARVKKEERIAHLRAEHMEAFHNYGYKGGTEGILGVYFGREEDSLNGDPK